MSICDELKKQAMQTYAEGIDKSIETVPRGYPDFPMTAEEATRYKIFHCLSPARRYLAVGT